MKYSHKIFALLSIMIVATFLRLYQLGTVPGSMNADEVAIGYNAYSILKTGKDEYGTKFPLLFRSFDDYKLPVYVYAAIPGIAAFGLNDFAVRLPSAIFGIATVLATYVLVELLFGSSAIALISAAILAISPWHLQFSRSAYEANIAVFFIVVGVAYLLAALKKKSYYVLGFLSLGLSTWSYHSPRIFVPLLIVGFFCIYFREIKKNISSFILGFFIFLVLFTPLVLLSISPEGLVRARGVSAFNDVTLITRNVAWRVTDINSHLLFSNIYHNLRLVNVSIFIKGYLDHYNPNYFFSEIVQAKYHAPGVGLMYIWELPFLLYGLHMVAGRKGKEKLLLFLWFLLAPVAAAPTHSIPHPVRTLIFLPTLQIFVAVGLWEAFGMIASLKKGSIVNSLLAAQGIVVVICFAYYMHQYYVHGPVDYAQDWQYGHEQVIRTVKIMQDKFDKIIISTSLDQPYIFFLYYLKYDPATYLAHGGTVSGKFDEERNAFDKYEFHSYMKYDAVIKSNVLYVGTPSESMPGTQLLVRIDDPSGQMVYGIYGAISKADWNNSGFMPYLKSYDEVH